MNSCFTKQYGNRVPWCKITHPNDNDALAKLNTPALLLGQVLIDHIL